MLEGDPDRDYLINGIIEGFPIVDTDDMDTIPPAEVDNYASATSGPARRLVEARIREEIADGGYVIVDKKPRIVSALSAIPKPDGDIRLVHDYSKPEHQGVNSYATKDPCKYQSVQDALDLLEPNHYMAKIDLKNAYRSVNIKPSNRTLTGLKWTFSNDKHSTLMVDYRIPFGSRKSPAIFNRITQAIKRIMHRKGHPGVVAYLDDFFITAKTFTECLNAYNCLISLLRSLGFRINWKKVVDPCQSLVFLGIKINSVQGTLTLDPHKHENVCSLLKTTLCKKRLSKLQLQSMAGKLNWASSVVPWGRTHICSLYHTLADLNKDNHKVLITRIRDDLLWWLHALSTGSSTRRIWDNRQTIQFATDSSQHACGAFCLCDWLYCHWRQDIPSIADCHINIKELAAVLVGLHRWAPRFTTKHVIVHVDNAPVVSMINNGSTRSPVALHLLKRLAAVSLTYNFTIEAAYIPGSQNDIPDALSRLHEAGQLTRFCSLIQYSEPAQYWSPVYFLPHHVSPNAFVCISHQVNRWFTSLIKK